MNRDYIIESNKAVEELITNGYKPQGRVKDFSKIALLRVKDDKLLFFKDYIQAKKELLDNLVN